MKKFKGDIIIVGLGKSAVEHAEILKKYITIGVNDVSKFLDPTYLVVLDKAMRFTPIRREFIERTRARMAFVSHPLDWNFRNLSQGVVELKTEKFNRSTPEEWVAKLDEGRIPHYLTSPFAAIGVAFNFGAKRIGLIGMDLRKDHHMGKHFREINRELLNYRKILEQKGVGLFNCSSIARLPSLPYMDLMAMLPPKRSKDEQGKSS